MRGNGLTIHIVDDDASVRESLKALLGAEGYEVHCYPSGRAFLEQAAGIHGCALIDLRLADTGGIEVQKALIAQGISIDVLVMSAYGDVEHAVQAMRLGAVDFIEKPFDPKQLLDRIHGLGEISRDAESGNRVARQHAALLETLTMREKQVFRGIVDGLSNKQVAADLGISPRTVETHRAHIMTKLQVDSLPHLVRIWLSAGHLLARPIA